MGVTTIFFFIKPDLLITIADPHRAGHELLYYPGELNTRSAEVVIINKVNTAKKEDIETVRNNVKMVNPTAKIIDGISTIIADDKDAIKGKKVLVIEDGPTVTHGGMKFGAGKIAAEEWGAKEIIDPRKYAVGSIVNTFNKYPHLTNILPAMGYGKKQIKELEKTINNSDCEVVISGTPIDITRVLTSSKPVIRVRYGVGEETAKELEKIVEDFIKKASLTEFPPSRTNCARSASSCIWALLPSINLNSVSPAFSISLTLLSSGIARSKMI